MEHEKRSIPQCSLGRLSHFGDISLPDILGHSWIGQRRCVAQHPALGDAPPAPRPNLFDLTATKAQAFFTVSSPSGVVIR